MAMPCIHGDVCRAYIREKCCILRSTCPKCEYYVPVGTMPTEREKPMRPAMHWPRWPEGR